MTGTAVIERQDAHNASVDAELARSGLCGTVHLATGRRCTLPVRHVGRCAFVHLRTGTSRSPSPVARGLGCVLGL